MGRVRQRDTKPEVLLRKELWRSGFRYRLHDKSLPGTPDIVFRSARIAIFVHGCFWHSHGCKRSQARPKTNSEFWSTKLNRNQERDAQAQLRLAEAGWLSVVVWECEPVDAAKSKIVNLLEERVPLSGIPN